MRSTLPAIFSLLLLALALSLTSCDRTPNGVLSKNEMANLIVDLELADAYIDSHIYDFTDDSSKQVLKQSIFKKHGITQQDYDSSLVWYAHNMEDYTKAYDKAIGKLKERYDKLDKVKGKGVDEGARPAEMNADGPMQGMPPAHGSSPRPSTSKRPMHKLNVNANASGDSIDLWNGQRDYLLNGGARRGFITFDFPPDANKKLGDRYQLAYKLIRGGNEFKVSLNIDYTDGGTAQITRSTNSDGWVALDVQSDSTRQVRRIYGYVSYDIKRGHMARVDSMMLIRSRLNKSNYGFIHAQRLLEHGSKK